jgi:hypothetical protein
MSNFWTSLRKAARRSSTDMHSRCCRPKLRHAFLSHGEKRARQDTSMSS